MITIGIREAKLFENDFSLLGDFFDFFCDELLGEGEYRTVYAFRYNPKLVVKICRKGFDNVAEFDIYQNVSYYYPKLAKFLAKPHSISSCGKVMLMERTRPLKQDDKLPKRIPAFIKDVKNSNWGRVGNRIICHDYANHGLYSKMDSRIIALP